MKRAVLAALLLALAACGGTSSAPQPAAAQLAHKIPGCHAFLAQTPDALAKADVSCSLGGTASAEVVTFASMGDEQKWITKQGNYYGCCVEGHLWAATYSSASGSYFPRIRRALGGREVAG
jgi:hypothetical protein